MKIQTKDCLEVLRRFDVAPETASTRDISRLHVTHPSPINTLADFRFGNTTYVLLFDEAAEDNATYIYEQAEVGLPGRELTLLKNPLNTFMTYALPYEGKSVYLLKADADKLRLDMYLAQEHPEYSRSSWQKHIKAGRVKVDGSIVTSAKTPVDESSDIDIELPEQQSFDDMSLPIIYIDDDFIAVDKPAGMLTHGKNQLDDEFTVAEFFRRYTTYGLEGDRPGIVHRLDRDTSGVLIGARSEAAYEFLKKQFQDRSVKKTYLAIVDGVPRNVRMHIDLPITRNQSKPGEFMAHASGKPAQTDLTVIKHTDAHTLVKLQPHTGRTHQLRVHLAYTGTPIVGDRLYGTAADRLYLHASEVGIKLPSGENRTFTSQTPHAFAKLLGADQT